ncbi:MAG: DUF1244 domain-containing protein [Proteobacteria bacterium]|nr:DUF1244 domain-containing protein [Pseudomonadota bacterium]
MTMEKETEIKARAFDRLISHLDSRKDVQNIDLMILANFCRNCLSNWMSEEAKKLNVPLDKESARQHVYKMPYSQFKEQYQTPVTDEKLKLFRQTKNQ